MAYIRKTVDVYELQGNYGYGDGYEYILEEEDRKEARERLKEYRENAPQYSYRIVKHRRPKEEQQ